MERIITYVKRIMYFFFPILIPLSVLGVLSFGPEFWFDQGLSISSHDPRLVILKFLPLGFLVFGATLSSYFNSGRLSLMGLFLIFVYLYVMFPFLFSIMNFQNYFGPAYSNSILMIPILIPLVFIGIHLSGSFNLTATGGLTRLWIVTGLLVTQPLLFLLFDSYIYRILDFLPTFHLLGGIIQISLLPLVLSFLALGIFVGYVQKSFYSNYISILFWVVLTSILSFELHLQEWYGPEGSPLFHAIVFIGVAFLFDWKVINLAYSKAYRDKLTQIFGRMALDERLERLSGDYAICMIDIDNFKDFNDKYGHDAGDKVLQMVADLIENGTSGEAYRFGGEEFTVVYPGKAKDDVAGELTELRKKVANTKVKVTRKSKRATKLLERKVTISLGLSEHDDNYTSPKDVLNAADNALFKAKDEGRNKLIVK